MILSENPALDVFTKKELIRKLSKGLHNWWEAWKWMEYTLTEEVWEAGYTVMVPTRGSLSSIAPPWWMNNPNCSFYLVPYVQDSKNPTHPQSGRLVPGDRERRHLDLSASTVEIRNQKQYFHQDHSWRGLIIQKEIMYSHEGGMIGIQTNIKCLLYQPSLQRSEKIVSSLIPLLFGIIVQERGKGMREVMRHVWMFGCLAKRSTSCLKWSRIISSLMKCQSIGIITSNYLWFSHRGKLTQHTQKEVKIRILPRGIFECKKLNLDLFPKFLCFPSCDWKDDSRK